MTKSKQWNQASMNRILLTMSLLALAGGGLTGQEKKQETIAVSLYAFDYAKGHETVYLARGKKMPQEIRLSTANILGVYSTVLDDDSRVVIRTREENEEGMIIYPPIAHMEIPANVKDPLLILLPALTETGDATYKILVIDRSLGNFPEGSYRLINFSPRDVRGLIGKAKVYAAARKMSSFNPSDTDAHQLDVYFQYKEKESWETFGRTRWVTDKKKRGLLCAYLDPRTRRMNIRGIPMSLIPPLPEKEAP